MRIIPLPAQEDGWRRDYVAMQEERFSIKPPTFDKLLDVIAVFQNTLNTAPFVKTA